MSSAKEKLPKLPVPVMAQIWLPMSLMSILMLLSFSDLLYFSPKQAESDRRFEELRSRYIETNQSFRDEVLTMKRAQIDNLKEIKDRLIVLEAAMGKIKPKKNPQPVASSPSEESAISLESMSDEEYQAMVLEYVKASDKQLVEQHFKQENAFKASLKPSEKRKFDADVNRECAKLLARCKVEGELSSLQKQVIRRSAESMVITDWRVKDSVSQQDDRWARYIERKREENRRWNEEHLKKMVEKFGTEFLERMQEESE